MGGGEGRGGVRQNGWVYLEMEELPYYTEVFLETPVFTVLIVVIVLLNIHANNKNSA